MVELLYPELEGQMIAWIKVNRNGNYRGCFGTPRKDLDDNYVLPSVQSNPFPTPEQALEFVEHHAKTLHPVRVFRAPVHHMMGVAWQMDLEQRERGEAAYT